MDGIHFRQDNFGIRPSGYDNTMVIRGGKIGSPYNLAYDTISGVVMDWMASYVS